MSPSDPSSRWPMPLWVAHRGAGKLAPENTLAAFRRGAALGWRAFECDVKLSRDGECFLLHDATLERTTNGHGTAGDLDWAALSRLDAGAWHSRGYAGEPLPHLDAIAAYVQRNAFALNIEIKPTPGTALATGRACGEAVERLWAQQAHRAVLFSSFQPEALQGARETAPEVPRALLLDRLWDGWFEAAQALACQGVVTNFQLMDAALVSQLHGAGLKAVCYTVNDPLEAQRLLNLAIDGLITDAVDRFAPAGCTAG